MESLRYWIQEDFSGGKNDVLQHDRIGDNEVLDMVNLFPRRDGYGVLSREGIVDYINSTLLPTFTSSSGTLSGVLCQEGDYNNIWAAVSDGTVWRFNGIIGGMNNDGTPIVTAVRVYDKGGVWSDDVSFCDWDGDTVFFSDGDIGLHMAKNTTTTDGASEVNDPAYPNISIRITNLRKNGGRLWGSNGSKVWFCGTDDARLVGSAWPRNTQVANSTVVYSNNYNAHYRCTVSGTTADTEDPTSDWTRTVGATVSDGTAVWECIYASAYPRYYSWFPGSTPIDDGGDVDVGDIGTDVTELYPLGDSGAMLVFKPEGIYHWNYPDGAAPWEVSEGADIQKISNVECLSNVVDYSGANVFIGRTTKGAATLYEMAGTEITPTTYQKLHNTMNRIVTNASPKLAVYDDRLYIIGRTTGGVTLAGCVDMLTGAYSDIQTSLSLLYSDSFSDGIIFGGSDEDGPVIFLYPYEYKDSHASTMRWSLKLRRVADDTIFRDVLIRNLWIEAGTDGSSTLNWAFDTYLSGDSTVTGSTTMNAVSGDVWYGDSFTGTFTWDDSDWAADGEHQETVGEVGVRCKSYSVELHGDCNDRTFLNKVMVGTFSRPQRST